jgi:hypothetical protein
MTKVHSSLWPNNEIFLIHLPVLGHLGFFHSLAMGEAGLFFSQCWGEKPRVSLY